MKSYGIILAGGTGKRMEDLKIPKQFLEIDNVPIIIHTVRQFLKADKISDIIIVIHKDWANYVAELLKTYCPNAKNISIVNGGKERLDSIENGLNYLKQNDANDDDIVIIHDAVRPFITQKIINDAIDETSKFKATVAIVPAKDTMICSENNIVTNIPNRNVIFHGQAPDSFTFGIIYNSIKKLTPEQRNVITGTVQICQQVGIPIHTYTGDEKNIKITTITDLFLAKSIYEECIKE